MRALLRLALLAAPGIVPLAEARAQAPEVFQFDVTHAVLEFGVRLVGFNRVRGTFDAYRGDVLLVGEDPLRSSVALSIDVQSIRTGNEERDDHLRSADFFDAARFPHISFVSQRVQRAGAGFVAVGPLTIRDVTREVRLPFEVIAGKGTDPFGNTRLAVAGKITIDRRDYGIVGPAFWNRAIGDSVEIEFEMPGRRWNYETMGLGTAARPSAGQRLLDAIAASSLEAAIAEGWRQYRERGADSTMNFGWFEYLKAAGRLAQQGRTREAEAALDLGARIAQDAARPASAANLRATLSELHLRGGDRVRAAEQARAALALDPSNTAALLLLRHLGG